MFKENLIPIERIGELYLSNRIIYTIDVIRSSVERIGELYLSNRIIYSIGVIRSSVERIGELSNLNIIKLIKLILSFVLLVNYYRK